MSVLLVLAFLAACGLVLGGAAVNALRRREDEWCISCARYKARIKALNRAVTNCLDLIAQMEEIDRA